MVEIIAGEKGKGKTKHLLDRVNGAVPGSNGNIVYLDKSQKHMYELSNKVRLINVKDYPIEDCDEFIGFICGIVSQDHDLASVYLDDLEELYLDSFLTIANIKDDEFEHAVEKLDSISEKYGVKMTLSVSMNEADFPEKAKSKIVISL